MMQLSHLQDLRPTLTLLCCVVFLLGFIRALAFTTHSFADYRIATGKPVGETFIFLNKALAVLVVLEVIFLFGCFSLDPNIND